MNVNFESTPDFLALEEIRDSGELLGKRAYVVTFGCQQNEADSEKVRGMLVGMGMTLTESPEDADVILMNTCAIREHAEMKALSMLGRFKALKKARPTLIIGILGCMAAEEKRVEMLKTDFHYVDFTIEPNMLHRLPTLILRTLKKEGRAFVFGEDGGDLVEAMPTFRVRGHRAWVSVMYGCNNFCSYCIVPYVRGRERSRESCKIIEECRGLVSRGIKDITLLGQNVNSYSSDVDFAELISMVAEIEGDFLIHFMTSHPKDVSPRLIEAMRRHSGKIAPYFHLPLQSGSNRILSLMNRTYTRERFLELVRALRESMPNIVLSTDVIIGFPGETEEDFLDTMDILSRVRFDFAYAFLYSARRGTRAARMTEQVERTVMDDRMARLLKMQTEISLEKNLSLVGGVQRVLVDKPTKRGGEEGIYTGRTASGKLVHFKTDENAVGEFRTVKIERAGAFDLFGSEVK